MTAVAGWFPRGDRHSPHSRSSTLWLGLARVGSFASNGRANPGKGWHKGVAVLAAWGGGAMEATKTPPVRIPWPGLSYAYLMTGLAIGGIVIGGIFGSIFARTWSRACSTSLSPLGRPLDGRGAHEREMEAPSPDITNSWRGERCGDGF